MKKASNIERIVVYSQAVFVDKEDMSVFHTKMNSQDFPLGNLCLENPILKLYDGDTLVFVANVKPSESE